MGHQNSFYPPSLCGPIEDDCETLIYQMIPKKEYPPNLVVFVELWVQANDLKEPVCTFLILYMVFIVALHLHMNDLLCDK